jgi:uncharacterized membrane protein YeaQ/YmgE (transglycosylase-associated protein family)
MDIIWTLVIGLLAGWLAGVIVRGYGFGVIGNIIVGIIGAFIGNWVFAALSIGSGTGMHFVSALVGAIILLFIIGLFRRSSVT